MNIFSNVSQQSSQNDKDREGKEKARIMENHAVEIREKKRLDTLKKNRMTESNSQQTTQQHFGIDQSFNFAQLAINSLDASTRKVVDELYKEAFTFDQIVELVVNLNSQDILHQHRGCIGMRKLLSNEENPPIQNAIDSNCVPRFIEFIKQFQYPILQLEAAWCLTNIASGTTHQTQSIIDKGAIPLFCKLLLQQYSDISEQAIWALGNISGDCSNYRDLILKCGGLGPLVKIIMNSSDNKTIKHGTWTLSNLCRGRPQPQYELVKDATEPLCKVLMNHTDHEVLTDSAWAISYLSDGDEDRVQRIINTGVVPTLVKLIGHQYLSIVIPCLRTLGNICTGNDQQTQLVISNGILEEIFKLQSHSKKAVRREALWVLSNISAGSAEHVSLILQSPQYMKELFNRILQDSEEVSREATWAISNSTSVAFPIDINKLVELRIFEVYKQCLETTKDKKQISVILESIKHILECGLKNYMQGQINPFAVQLESFGLIDIIENLQSDQDSDIYKRASDIIQNYFEVEESVIDFE